MTSKFEQAELLRQAAAKLPHTETELRYKLYEWSKQLLHTNTKQYWHLGNPNLQQQYELP